jgi:transposase
VIIDGPTLRSRPESGCREGYDGHKVKKGSKVHVAVGTLGHLLALKVTAANEQDLQKATGEKVEVAFVDQGYTGEEPAEQAAKEGVRLIVVKLNQSKRSFILLPRRWVVEGSFAWAARFCRLVRLRKAALSSLARLRWLSFLSLMLNALFQNPRHALAL